MLSSLSLSRRMMRGAQVLLLRSPEMKGLACAGEARLLVNTTPGMPHG